MEQTRGTRKRELSWALVAAVVLVGTLMILPGPVGASNKYFARFVVDYANNLAVNGVCVGDFTYPADTPMFFVDGWAFAPWKVMTGLERLAAMGPNTGFTISLDGVVQPMPMVEKQVPAYDMHLRFWDVEYDTGFPVGTQATFVGTWYIDGLLLGGTLGERVVTLTCTSTVTFVAT